MTPPFVSAACFAKQTNYSQTTSPSCFLTREYAHARELPHKNTKMHDTVVSVWKGLTDKHVDEHTEERADEYLCYWVNVVVFI